MALDPKLMAHIDKTSYNLGMSEETVNYFCAVIEVMAIGCSISGNKTTIEIKTEQWANICKNAVLARIRLDRNGVKPLPEGAV